MRLGIRTKKSGCAIHFRLEILRFSGTLDSCFKLLGSSMVEPAAVNRVVRGSSPLRGASFFLVF